jgi:hypothetical protein
MPQDHRKARVRLVSYLAVALLVAWGLVLYFTYHVHPGKPQSNGTQQNSVQ